MLRRLLCLALVAVATRAAAAPPPAPQKNWLQLETPNFRVIGSAGERDLRRAATRLEQFRETLGILFPKAVLVSSVPTTVIVFRGDKEYRPFKPLYNGKPKEISGFFLPGRTVNYVTMAAAGVEEFGIVYHEYVHLVVNNTLQGTPLWFNEGLADYYATFEVTGGGKQASLGRLQSNHVLRLREQWMPLGELVKVGHDSPYYNESDKMSVFYAESWALVHYLLLGHEGQYAKGIGTFVADLANGKSLDDASGQAFGLTAAALERELRRYVDGERFVRQVVTFTTKVGAIDDVPVSPLEPASAHAALGDLLLRMDRPDEARAAARRGPRPRAGAARRPRRARTDAARRERQGRGGEAPRAGSGGARCVVGRALRLRHAAHRRPDRRGRDAGTRQDDRARAPADDRAAAVVPRCPRAAGVDDQPVERRSRRGDRPGQARAGALAGQRALLAAARRALRRQGRLGVGPAHRHAAVGRGRRERAGPVGRRCSRPRRPRSSGSGSRPSGGRTRRLPIRADRDRRQRRCCSRCSGSPQRESCASAAC